MATNTEMGGPEHPELQDLLASGEVTGYMGITQSQLQKAFPNLHYLILGKRHNVYPRQTITGLQDFRQHDHRKKLGPVSRDFSQTQAATAAIIDAEAGLTAEIEAIRTEDYHVLNIDFARIFHTSPDSLRRWQAAQVIPRVVSNNRHYVDLSVPEAVYSWHYPQLYTGPRSFDS